MIWKTEHINPDALEAAQSLRDQCVDSLHLANNEYGVVYLAVVGGGPKGFYALMRLADLLSNQEAGTPQVKVHWFNPGKNFGSGPNFDSRQPEFLLINNPVGTISCYPKPHPVLGLSSENLSFAEWIALYTKTKSSISGTDFASRALVGHYLSAMVSRFLSRLPSQLEVVMVDTEVVDLAVTDDGHRVRIPGGGELPFDYASVLLATGHSYENRAPAWDTFAQSADDVIYIPKVYPVEKLGVVPSGSEVAMLGMGLTFVDAALALTEGRGGRFEQDGPQLRYIPSGTEPAGIIPFSRTNLPMMPRGATEDEKKYRLRYITPEWVDRLRKTSTKVDFLVDVLPVLDREFLHAYYRVYFQALDADRDTIENQIEQIPEEKRFTLDKFLFDTLSVMGINAGNHHLNVMEYLKAGLAEAEKGELESPLMAAVAVWREATPLIGQLYRQGGFTGDSQRLFDEKYYAALSRISFGPPVENVRKVLCLAEAGIVQFKFSNVPRADMLQDVGAFVVSDGHSSFETGVLIDARMACPDIARRNAALYAKLQDNGLASPMDNEGYLPGCADMTGEGRLISNQSEASAIFAYGTPTEGATLDNDSLSPDRHDFGTAWAKFVANLITLKKPMLHEN